MGGNAKKPESKGLPVAPSEVSDAQEYIVETARELSFHEQLQAAHVPTQKGLGSDGERMVQAFQSNLLSLISHELRTPLMGVQNALNMMELADSDPKFAAESGLSKKELLEIATRNTTRLERSLLSLLDLAAIESRNFHLRLKEVNLSRVITGRVANFKAKEKGFKVKVSEEKPGAQIAVLGDPARLGRAVDLLLELFSGIGATDASVKLAKRAAVFSAVCSAESAHGWDVGFRQAEAALVSGIASPASAFGQALQSEDLFLARKNEGVGTEALLLLEIIRRHQGTVVSEVLPLDRGGAEIRVAIELPILASEDGVRQVLASRALSVSTDLATVGLVMIAVPDGAKYQDVEAFQSDIRKALFRASDQAYALPEKRRVVLILDDCKPEDIPSLMERMQKHMGRRLRYGIASCPMDGLDPGELFVLAEKRLASSSRV